MQSAYLRVARELRHDFTMCMSAGFAQTPTAYTFSLVDILAVAVPGSVLAIEDANEINNISTTWKRGRGMREASTSNRAPLH